MNGKPNDCILKCNENIITSKDSSLGIRYLKKRETMSMH